MSKRTICRVSFTGCGLTPSDLWVEARTLSKGFSVVFYHSDFQRKPKRVFTTSRDYTAELFTRGFRNIGMEGPLEDNEWRFVRVYGAEGLDALFLRASFCGCFHDLTDWLYNLDNQSKKLIEECVDYDDISQLRVIDDLIEHANQLGKGWTLSGLLNQYELPMDWQGIEKLSESLEEEIEAIQTERFERKRKERELKVQPFLDEIKFIADQFDPTNIRGAGGMHPPSPRQVITKWVEDFVYTNSSLPVGKYEIKYSFFGPTRTLGEVDFTEILARREKI